MTIPPTGEPGPDTLPPVDSVIHDAREGSWHLPETRPSLAAAPAAAPSGWHAATDDHGTAGTSASAARGASGQAAASGHGAVAAQGATSTHGGGHGEEEAEPLGPVDVEMWGAGIAATIVGLFMAICFVVATSGVGAY